MEKRFNLQEIEPNAAKAMFGLEAYLSTTAISNIHKELVKIRASQINGCAFCIDMHTKDALKYGETQQRIFLLNAWRETNLFTEEEKLVLALTEEVTLIRNQGVTEATYQKAVAAFGQNYVAQLIMLAVTINAWNRIAISTHLQVPQ
jgi:AhpD family alkylhydroperoxidase